jgi:hypothetical protein
MSAAESSSAHPSKKSNPITNVASDIASKVAGKVAETVAPLIPESVYGTMGKQFINIICETLYHGSDELKLHPKEEILNIIEEQLKRGLRENVEQINKRMNEVIAEETRKYMQPFLSNNTISVYMMKDILTKHFDLCVSIIQKAKSSIHKNNTEVEQKVTAIMEQLTKPVLNVSIQKGGSVINDNESGHNSTFTYMPSDTKIEPSVTSIVSSDTKVEPIVTPSIPSVSDSSFEKLAKESVSIFKEKMDKHVTGEEINDVIINGLQYHIEKPEGRQMFLRQIEPVLRSYALEYTNKGQSLAILFSHLCSIEPIHSIMKNNLTDYANNKVDARIACNNIKNAMNTNINVVNPLNGIYKDMETYFTKPQIIEKIMDDSNKTICTGTQQLKNAITGNNEISAVEVVKSANKPTVLETDDQALFPRQLDENILQIMWKYVKPSDVETLKNMAYDTENKIEKFYITGMLQLSDYEPDNITIDTYRTVMQKIIDEENAKLTKKTGGKPKRVSKTKRRRRTFCKRNMTQRYL